MFTDSGHVLESGQILARAIIMEDPMTGRKIAAIQKNEIAGRNLISAAG